MQALGIKQIKVITKFLFTDGGEGEIPDSMVVNSITAADIMGNIIILIALFYIL